MDSHADSPSSELSLESLIEEIRRLKVVAASRLKLLEDCYKADASLVRARHERDTSPLRFANSSNVPDFELSELLVNYGADVGSRDSFGTTVLHLASKNGDADLVKLLLKNRAKIDVADSAKMTPLLVACEEGHVDVVSLLLKKGAKVDRTNVSSRTPLHLACQAGHYDVVELLLQNGAAVNAKDNCQVRPLHLAAENRHERIVGLLLTHGAKVKAEEFERNCDAFDHNIVAILSKYGSSRNFLKEAPLHVACKQGDTEAARVLLDYNADINIEVSSVGDSSEPNTPIDFAVRGEHEETFELLLARGARLSNSRSTSLHLAAAFDNLKFCQLLISAGAEINAKDHSGSTPLHVAWPSTLQFLITQGADVSVQNNQGMYPLHTLPSEAWYDESVVTLLAKEVGLNCRDNRGRTPLHIACELNDVRKLTVLLKGGADVNSQDCNGLTPLSYAHSTNVVPDTVVFLKSFIKMMRAVDFYVSPIVLQNIESLHLDDECSKELTLLKKTTIGHLKMTYYEFLRKSVDQLVMKLNNEHVTQTYNVESLQGFGGKFPNFQVLIRRHFNTASVRKALIEKIKFNCCEVFRGLNENCVDEILKYFSNTELSAFADAFAETDASAAD